MIFVNRLAYDLFVAAMRLVNARLGMGPPEGEIYTFRGSRLLPSD